MPDDIESQTLANVHTDINNLLANEKVSDGEKGILRVLRSMLPLMHQQADDHRKVRLMYAFFYPVLVVSGSFITLGTSLLWKLLTGAAKIIYP